MKRTALILVLTILPATASAQYWVREVRQVLVLQLSEITTWQATAPREASSSKRLTLYSGDDLEDIEPGDLITWLACGVFGRPILTRVERVELLVGVYRIEAVVDSIHDRDVACSWPSID